MSPGVASRTVLVVDDEPTVRDALAERLAEEGFAVVTAADGPRALERFRADKPDLVVLDLMLPGLPGIEVCRTIRRESAVPIIMLTAKDSELDKVLGLELGADDYVTKPFSLRELTARIRAVLRRGEAPTEPGLRLGDVEVDLAGHQIIRDGVALPITPRAFDLLAFLARHPGQVFSREQLVEQVWGYDYAGETRTVDVHVHWLRAHIEEDPTHPRYLQTVRGTGYVLRLPR
ncbi:MAG TPA: response regulator transcription factor [Candidatus Limnocylindrales bacterium]|nr:response regulator transcription factor [Candidatus Limnocylindrales bacterium]